MEHKLASLAFAMLGHPDRLAVYRLLMRFAPQGARPKDIAEALQLKPNTLSHHLNDLSAGGLISVERRGRALFYSVDRPRARELIGYLALDVARARPDLLSGLPGADRGTAPGGSGQASSGLGGSGTGAAALRHVLFICSGNSARSIIAEALLRDLGAGRFVAHSAGTNPRMAPNPQVLDLLRRNGHDTAGLRSKALSDYQRPDAPRMDFVFSVCDAAAAEECPPWPGRPLTGHWGLPDPVRAPGNDAEKALVYARTYAALRRRIEAFIALPESGLDAVMAQAGLDRLPPMPDTTTISKDDHDPHRH